MDSWLKQFEHAEILDKVTQKQLQVLDFRRYLAEHGRLPAPLHSEMLPSPYSAAFNRYLTLGKQMLMDDIAYATKRHSSKQDAHVTYLELRHLYALWLLATKDGWSQSGQHFQKRLCTNTRSTTSDTSTNCTSTSYNRTAEIQCSYSRHP